MKKYLRGNSDYITKYINFDFFKFDSYHLIFILLYTKLMIIIFK